MTFPVVAASNSGTDVTAAAAAGTVQLPAGITAGDLLLIFAGFGLAITNFAAAGWSTLYGATSARAGCLYKIATGAEGASIAVTWTTSTTARFRSLRVNSWHGTTVPEAGVLATASSTIPDPPNLAPSWGADDTLWIAHYGAGTLANTTTAFPTNYTSNQYSALDGNTSAAHVGIASRNLNAASDNPGTFTITSAAWGANTVAIRPAASVTPTPQGSDSSVSAGGGGGAGIMGARLRSAIAAERRRIAERKRRQQQSVMSIALKIVEGKWPVT